jgi:hypothetical protein
LLKTIALVVELTFRMGLTANMVALLIMASGYTVKPHNKET